MWIKKAEALIRKGKSVWIRKMSQIASKCGKVSEYRNFFRFSTGKRLWKKMLKTKNGSKIQKIPLKCRQNGSFPHFVLIKHTSFPQLFPKKQNRKSLITQGFFRFSTVSAHSTATTATLYNNISICLSPAGKGNKMRRRFFL